ncbi:MAG: YncE family protein [Actinomycetota bacterium]
MSKVRLALVGALVLAFASAPAHAVSLLGPSELYSTPVGSAPGAIAWSPTSAKLFVGNTGSGTVSVIDELQGAVTEEIPVGPAPQGIVVDPAQDRVYVALGLTDKIAVLNALTGAFVRDFTVPQCAGVTGPWGLAVNPATSILYVACYSANELVSVQDTTGAILHAVATGSGPLGVVVDPTTNFVYLGQYGESEIRIIDGASLTTIGRLRAGIFGGVWGLALDPLTHRVFAANFKQGTIQVILASHVIATYGGFSGPEWIGFDPLRDEVWVPENTASSRVTAVDPITGATTPVAISGTQPTAVAVDPILGIAYSTDYGTTSVSAIRE